jgi:metal-dependent hydrolase (beta-lactamase superfamily II)
MVEKIRLTALVEDSLSTTRRRLIAEHGLSFFIEGEKDG